MPTECVLAPPPVSQVVRAGLATCLPSSTLCGCEAQPTEDSERALGTVWEKGRQDLYAAVTFQRLTVK